MNDLEKHKLDYCQDLIDEAVQTTPDTAEIPFIGRVIGVLLGIILTALLVTAIAVGGRNLVNYWNDDVIPSYKTIDDREPTQVTTTDGLEVTVMQTDSGDQYKFCDDILVVAPNNRQEYIDYYAEECYSDVYNRLNK